MIYPENKDETHIHAFRFRFRFGSDLRSFLRARVCTTVHRARYANHSRDPDRTGFKPGSS